MGQDIYGYDATYKGAHVLTAKEMKLIVGGSGNTGSGTEYLIQNVSVTYQQPIQIVRELSSGNGYLHSQPPQGMINIERIIGTKSIGDVLGPPGTGIWKGPVDNEDGSSRTIQLKPIDSSTQGSKYTMEGCIVTNLSVVVDANRSLVVESCQIRFGKMSIE